MKNYMPLDGLRCSRDSGSAHCDTPKSAVLGRPGGGIFNVPDSFYITIRIMVCRQFATCTMVWRITRSPSR